MAISGIARYADSGFNLPWVPGHGSSIPKYDFTANGQAVALSLSQGAGLPTGGATVAGIQVYIRGVCLTGQDGLVSNYLTLAFNGTNVATFTPLSAVAPGDIGFSLGANATTNPNSGVAWTTTDIFSGVWTVTFTQGAGGNARTIEIYECCVAVQYNLANATLTPSSGPVGTTVTINGGGLHAFAYAGAAGGSIPAAGVYVWNGLATYATTVNVINDDNLTFVVPSWTPGAVAVYIKTYDGTGIDKYAISFPSSSFTLTMASWWNLPSLAFGPFGQLLPVNYYKFQVAQPSGYVASAEPAKTGWFESTDTTPYSGAATLIVGGIPHDPRSFVEVGGFATGSAAMFGGFPGVGVNFRNHFIYAAGDYSVGTDSPTLRIFDGVSDRQIATVPNTSAGAVPKAIMSMMVDHEIIFLTTYDSGTTSADFAGRVFSFDPISGAMSQIGAAFGSGELPYSLCWHMNRLWVGTNKGDGTAGKIYFFRPNIDSAWTTDYDLTTATQGGAISLCSYKGNLYVGTSQGAGTFSKVLQRDSLGAYTTSDTGAGGVATANNCFLHQIVYGTNLYATFWNPDTPSVAKIRKYDGSSWSTVYTGSSGTIRPFIGQFIVNNVLLVVGGGDKLTACVLASSDGTTFTDETANLIGTSSATPVFGEVVI